MHRRALAAVAALTILAQQRQSPAQRPQDPLTGLGDYQRAYVDDPSRRRVVTGGRRSGKTEALIADLLATAIKGGECVYISLTRKLAKKTVWKRLKARARGLKLEFSTNETELVIQLAGGGSIELGGAKDKADIERYRGPSYRLIVIDECGAQNPELLKTLVNDVLRPALMDHEAPLVLAGTPGPTLEGYWFDVSNETARTQPNVYCWTLHQNPIFDGRAESELDAVIEENAREGWTREHVTFKREYLGQWVRDDSVLVYPFEVERNGLEYLPETTPNGWSIDHTQWRRVISIDVGTSKDSMAFVVWAGHPGLPHQYIVHAEAHTKMLIPALVDRVRLLKQRYPRSKLVIDAGGMGAAHAQELRAMGIYVEAAVKTEKASSITVLREMLLAGVVKLLALPSLDGLRTEWGVLGWDAKHLQHNPNQADHYSDAALYGLRALKGWRVDSEHGMPKAPRMSEARMLELEQEEDERDERSVMGRGRRLPTGRPLRR